MENKESKVISYLNNLIISLIEGNADSSAGLIGHLEKIETDIQFPDGFIPNLRYFTEQYILGASFLQSLANGNLELAPPDDPQRRNFLIAQFKQLHSSLRHFAWQMQQITKGDLKQKVSFLGEFSVVFNSMIEALREKMEMENQIREQNRQLQLLIKEKDRIFSIIGHDLRSPFNAIVGYSDLLSFQIAENDLENIDEYTQQIQTASKRAMDLLTNLLEWARCQTGKIVFHPDLMDISSLIKDVILLLSHSADQKRITIVADVPDSMNVRADKEMISTVVRNLVSNAIKFTPADGQIFISLEPGSNSVTTSVRDTGVGIPPSLLENIFGFEGGKSRPGTNNEQGTGLGLILCKEFIDKHKGTIKVESSPGEGSKFSFTIPVEELNHLNHQNL